MPPAVVKTKQIGTGNSNHHSRAILVKSDIHTSTNIGYKTT
jgi:hypothetical protein